MLSQVPAPEAEVIVDQVAEARGATVRKTYFLSRFYMKTIILPRQARDKHIGKTQKKYVFLRLLWGALSHWREDWPVPAENDSEYKAVMDAAHQLNDKCSKRRARPMMMHEMNGGVCDVRMMPPLRKRAGPLLPLLA